MLRMTTNTIGVTTAVKWLLTAFEILKEVSAITPANRPSIMINIRQYNTGCSLFVTAKRFLSRTLMLINSRRSGVLAGNNPEAINILRPSGRDTLAKAETNTAALFANAYLILDVFIHL